MHERAVVVHAPANAARLVLLFHGVGSTASNLTSLGVAIARACPDAMVVSVDAPHPSTLGSGREWFSVAGITEQDRPARIAQAMPLFGQAVAHWQQRAGVDAARTTLIGFSQGAIMALESTQTGDATVPPPAARIVSLAGRFAAPVRSAPAGVRYHLIHGAQDGVIGVQYARQAAAELAALGAGVTLDELQGLGHGIDARELQLVLGYLHTTHAAPA